MAEVDLAYLQAFAAARERSFRDAGAKRGTSASTLSEAVRRLEWELGVRFLNRTPTDAGAKLLERLTPVLGEVAAALDAVNTFRDSPTRTLRLNVPSFVARSILPPILSGFLKAHTGITVEVVAEDSFIDVWAARFDAGVRYDERLEQDMIAVPIGPLVASNFELELAAALDGLGVICTFEEVLAPAIASGHLKPVLEDWSEPFSGPFLYYPSRRYVPVPLRSFVDYLKELSKRNDRRRSGQRR